MLPVILYGFFYELYACGFNALCAAVSFLVSQAAPEADGCALDDLFFSGGVSGGGKQSGCFLGERKPAVSSSAAGNWTKIAAGQGADD